MQSKAKTVAGYLAELPPDRRAAIQAVREVILKNLDPDYEEGMQYGAIAYSVPHRVYPAGYHCDPSKPLPFAGLGSQKNHMSLGLMSNYFDGAEDKWFRAAWAKTGKKLDMGACCIRFKRLDDLPLELIGEAVRRVPARAFVAQYTKILSSRTKPSVRTSRTKNAPKRRPAPDPKPRPGNAAAKQTKSAKRSR